MLQTVIKGRKKIDEGTLFTVLHYQNNVEGIV
jgi:hypothetical protein